MSNEKIKLQLVYLNGIGFISITSLVELLLVNGNTTDIESLIKQLLPKIHE